MNHAFDTISTPVGPFSIAVDANGHITATAFGGKAALQRRLGPGKLVRDAAQTRFASEQVRAYFAGKQRDFTLPFAPAGTAFQQRVWSALAAIPYGETRTYGQIAAVAGKPSAARAVGRANATNPICLIVPCHRVIGADGSMTGFAFGETIKRRLLEHEQVTASHSRAA
ncbi:methylated-DNA--[protein]-cysteine S-methyltransferase [Horticoccus sp. 23ND18S-11]|uniref:methylated-DNA--[protein]-cysteine S-methyltransferase n=1 Tax=Horticoccus sp. 23ND18S-11 TaxID=3391832 RepID=UPI0039C9469C